MSTQAATASPDLDPAALAHRMTEAGVRALPVVDADGSLVGIVTYRDLLRVLPADKPSPGSRADEPVQSGNRSVRGRRGEGGTGATGCP
ncbi:CBS domain-containing protein [Amycolatopsis sp. NPDC049253]|uniref:CBS domain-containing protein n=1 Tax=Amycolatopsis sp. NPDC049253 TaxID=3155274 RepID=UPI0034482718